MATKSAVPMACVRIGFESLLMPVAKATQVITLLQSSVTCEERYDSTHTYTIGEQPEVSMAMVKPSQVRRAPTPGRNGDPLAIESDLDDRSSF